MKEDSSQDQGQKGMETTLSMDACLWYGACDFYMELYGLYGILF